MSEWQQAALGSLTTKIGSGATPRGGGAVYQAHGVSLIRSQNVLDNSMKVDEIAHLSDAAAESLRGVTVEAGDVLINITGDSVARCTTVNPSVLPARVNQHVAILRPSPSLNALFLQKLLVSPDMKSHLLTIATGGGTRNALTKTQLSNLVIAIPPLPEQQAIAEVLGALDDKIAANTALAATADAMIALAYAAALGGGATERPLLDELLVEFGEPFAGDSFADPGVGRPLIRIRDLKSFESQVWTTEVRKKEAVVRAGDVLVGMDAEFRATSWLGEPGVLNQRVLRARHTVHGRALVREMLQRPLMEVEGEKSATTVIHLNKSDLARKTVLLPGQKALTQFESLAEPLYESRVALAAENRTLAATRDALLPHLMSGKLRVRDAERVASEAGA